MSDSHQIYQDLQTELVQGWNTWDTRSVLTHVHLPLGLAFRLGLKEYRDGGHLREALIGRMQEGAETVVPGPRSWDGAYTSLQMTWRGVEIVEETATSAGFSHKSCYLGAILRSNNIVVTLRQPNGNCVVCCGCFLWHEFWPSSVQSSWL